MIHDRAAILSIGDELILGQTLDTNSRWLSQRLTELGVRVVEHATIPDDLPRHVAALRRLAADVPLILSTGGLGPTDDDLTRDALAQALGEPLVEDAAALRNLEALLALRGRALSSNQRRQVLRPASAQSLANPMGTAPGLAARLRLSDHHAADIFSLPGPPNELRPMFDTQVAPALTTPPGRDIAVRIFPTLGLGESDLAARLGDLMARDRNPLVGTTASGSGGGVVTVRLRYEGDASRAKNQLDHTEKLIRNAIGPFIFGEGDDTIESVVVAALRRRNEQLIVVESCTGGLLGAAVSAVPGASVVFLGGWITYANQMKTSEVAVPPELLLAHGAVSEEVARAMALGALRTPAGIHAAHALAITGVAGPDGGSTAKPVGTVFIARASRSPAAEQDHAEVRRFRISGDRSDVRSRAATLALAMLRFHLVNQRAPRLLWQSNPGPSPMTDPGA